MLEQVRVTRYVTPLKEGGSLPGIVEAEDLGTYVAKFRGAGQGLKVLVAEVIVGEIARLLRIPTPRLVELDLAAAIAKYEADQEVQDLLNASIGSNLGVDFLPGSFGYDGSRPPSPQEAADIIWLDAFTANVDRTWANPNLLVWHGTTWTIDHGAALYFHHAWPRREPNAANFAAQPFDASRHVLADLAEPIEAAHERLAPRLTEAAIADAINEVPPGWLEPTTAQPDTESLRAAYREHLLARLATTSAWLPGAPT